MNLSAEAGWGYAESIRSWLGVCRSRETNIKFRKDLLENGDRVGHLFSCAEDNQKTNRLLFDMCEDTFQTFGDHFLSIVLTGSWKVVKQTPRLRFSDSMLSIVQ